MTTIRDADDKATFSRLHPIPFTVRIPKNRIDRELPVKLLLEAEGILAWVVAGAIEWCKSGLMKPPEVEAANDQWRSEVDQLGRFIEERCVVAQGVSAPASSLYAEHKRWAEAGGESIITSTAFGRKLSERGFQKEHNGAVISTWESECAGGSVMSFWLREGFEGFSSKVTSLPAHKELLKKTPHNPSQHHRADQGSVRNA